MPKKPVKNRRRIILGSGKIFTMFSGSFGTGYDEVTVFQRPLKKSLEGKKVRLIAEIIEGE